MFNGKQYQANPVPDIQFFKQCIPVTINSAWAQVHVTGNFLIGHFGTGQF